MVMNKEKALEISREIFQNWCDALKTENTDEVVKLYAEENLFLPTMSGDFKHGKLGDEEYFKHFLEIHPESSLVSDDVVYTDDMIVHVGFYDFEVDEEDHVHRKNVHARFTFVYKKYDDGWKIVHHHSSLKPKD